MKLPIDYLNSHWKVRKKAREEYIERQYGFCYWCDCSLDRTPPPWITEKEIDWDLFPPFFLEHPIHLQHNHETGMTEGAVHAYCNAVMWQYYGR